MQVSSFKNMPKDRPHATLVMLLHVLLSSLQLSGALVIGCCVLMRT